MALLKKTPVEIPDAKFMREKEEEFFSSKFFLSYSGLNKLLYSPTLFYSHYILKQRDIDDNKGLEGRLIHCQLLTPERFSEQFVLAQDGIISGKGKMVLDLLYAQQSFTIEGAEEPTKPNLEDLRAEIISFMNDAEYYQKIIDEDKRFNKMLSPEAMQYWDHLWNARGKSLVSPEMMMSVATMVHMIRSNGYIMELMGENYQQSFEGVDKYNEIHLMSPDGRKSFGLQGVLDNLVIDHGKKVVRINDLKTTSKDITKFKESIEYYNYLVQAAMYKKLVMGLPQVQSNGYAIEFRFIVVDPYMQVKSFKVKDETMDQGMQLLEEKLDECQWHFDNRRFDLPYEYALENDYEI
jgi:hypothetical protein